MTKMRAMQSSTKRYKKSIVVALACALSVTATACSDKSEQKNDAPTPKQSGAKNQFVKAAEACEGILDATVATEATKETGEKEYISAPVEGTPGIAKSLTNQKDTVGTSYDICHLKSKSGDSLLSLDVAWVAHRVPGGESVRYTLGKPNSISAARLEVRCKVDGNRVSQQYAMDFNLSDSFPLSTRSHAKILTSAARRVTDSMDCQEKPEYLDTESAMQTSSTS